MRTTTFFRGPLPVLPPPEDARRLMVTLAQRPRPRHRPAPVVMAEVIVRVVGAVRSWVRNVFVSWSRTGFVLAVSGARGPPD